MQTRKRRLKVVADSAEKGSKEIKSSQDSTNASEGSDSKTPKLTTGLRSSSKNVSNNSKNKRTTVKRKTDKKGKKERTATSNIEDPPELNKVLPSLADIKAITKPSKDVDLPVDILLLTVTNCEFLACYSELKNPYRCWFDGLGYVYFSDVGESQEELKVALLRCYRNGIGPGGALVSVKNAASVLRPKAVISVGTCSGLDPAKSNLGDVVVSAKLATYASKVVTSNQEQSTGMRSYVSKRFLDVIKNCADGWQAPLKDLAESQQVQVFTDAEFLSGPEQVRAEWWRDQLAETNPQAMAIENEGEGVFTAAFDCQIEWLIVKGIADYADGSQLPSESWSSCASVMAASLVAHILSEPCVFYSWPHCQDLSQQSLTTRSKEQLSSPSDTSQQSSASSSKEQLQSPSVSPGKLVELIRRDYKGAVLCPFPWCEDELQLKLSNIFTKLQIVSRTKERSKLTNDTIDMTDVFKPHPDCDNPRVVLIEGNPGMGKTTYCQKLAYDWSVLKIPSDASFPKVKILLLLKCRDMYMKTANIEEAIDDQLLPQDAGKKEKEDFFQFIRCNQSRIVLVLDGLDELRDDLLQDFLPLIQGKVFSNVYLILTSRHKAGMKVRRYCDTRLEIIGYSEGDVESYIKKYFSSHKNQSLADKMIQKLNGDRHLKQLTTNPLNTALLCLLCEETRGEFPSKKTKIYNDLVACALRRFFAKKGIPLGDDDPMQRCSSELNKLGRMAFEALCRNESSFSQDEVKSQSTVDFRQLPFLSREPSKSKIRPSSCYAFTHRTFQEYFAAFYLAHQLLSGDKGKEKLLDELIPFRYWQVWEFLITQALSKSTEAAVIVVSCLCDSLHRNLEIPPSSTDPDLHLCVEIVDKEKCDSYVKPLTISSEEEEILLDLLMKTLRLIAECEDGDIELKDYQKEVARKLARCFPLKKLGLVPGAVNNLVLSEYLKFNCSLTRLCLFSEIDAPLLSTTIKLVLRSKEKGVKFHLDNYRDQVLDESLAVKAFLEDVFQSGCFQAKELSVNCLRISDEGCQLIAEFLQTNCTLNRVYLSNAKIDDGGATAIGDALKSNFTLTHLSLPRNMIGGVGAAAIATGLRSNPVLTYLDLSWNAGGGGLIAMAPAQALESNCALKYLDVCYTFNALGNDKIGPSGPSALARALRFNRTLTHLNLRHCDIDDSVASALGEALQTNSALMDLNLADNQIGETGTAALGKALQSNHALTHLNLERNNGIGDTGAEALGKALQSNHTLTHLNLMGSKRIGDTGAEAIAKALQVSGTRLTLLDLEINSITSSGATAIAEALHTNTSLTHLSLRENKICCDGASAFAKALKRNCTLTHLNLSANGIGDLGATELALALKVNNTLRFLNLGENCLIRELGEERLRQVDRFGEIVPFRFYFRECGSCNCTVHRVSMQEQQ